MLTLDDIRTKMPEELAGVFSDLENQLHEKEKVIANQEKLIGDKEKTITSKTKLIDEMRDYILLLKHRQFAARSERYIDPSPQGRLFDEAELPANTAEIETAESEITVPAHARKKPGRKPLPADLPRQRIIHDLSEADKQCGCGHEMTCIGDVCTEQLDIIPAKVTVLEHVQKKYACKRCHTGIKTAPKPAQPIPKSIASPGVLAHVLTSKFQFHLPLYRQEQLFHSIGVDLPRKTLSLWVIRSSELLQPLVNLLTDEILSYDVAYADESTVQVLRESGKTAESTSYMWVYGGGNPTNRCYVYQYHPSRRHQVALDFFQGYRGYLHCDGYGAYDQVAAQNSDVKLVGCWYHARRKFSDAAKVNKKSGLAKRFMSHIQKLAKVEAAITADGLPAEAAHAYRQTHAPPIMKEIQSLMNESSHRVPPNSVLGKAVTYLKNQWPKLQVYLEDGRLEISNNRLERAIKPFATGRKNWLFSNSESGAHAAANIFSLIETCKANDVNPYDWLRYALERLPSCQRVEDYEALLPFHFDNGKQQH